MKTYKEFLESEAPVNVSGVAAPTGSDTTGSNDKIAYPDNPIMGASSSKIRRLRKKAPAALQTLINNRGDI